MKYPHLIYAEDPEYPNEIAVHASLVPTFEPPAPQEEFEILEEEGPEQTVLSFGEDFVFIFIIDRSGSMRHSRIQTAKEALKLFLKSLPLCSKFAIISFGTRFEYLQINYKQIIEYNDKNANKAIDLVEKFEANFKKTDILTPLESA